MRTTFLTAVTAAVVLAAANADADEPETRVGAEPQPSPTAPAATDESALRLDVLERTLRFERTHTSTLRTGFGIGGLAVGAAATPVGLVSFARQPSVGAYMTATIGTFGLMTAALAFIPWTTPWFEELEELERTERTAGRPPSEIVEQVEAEWRRKAEKARKGRTLGGVFGLSVGLTALALGSGILLSEPSSSRISIEDYRAVGGVVTLFGGIETFLGVLCFTTDEPVESALHRYEATAPRRAALQVVPTLSGVVGTF